MGNAVFLDNITSIWFILIIVGLQERVGFMKFIKAFITLCILLVASSAYAEKTNASTQNPMEWYINSTESFTGVSKDAPIWHVLQETKLGIFAYDERSLGYAKTQGTVDENILAVTVKTAFTDKNALKQLQDKYAAKLPGKEKPQYWLLKMRFDMAHKLYTIDKTEYYTNKNTLLDTVERKGDMVEIPEGSFAEAMYLECQTWLQEAAKAAEK